MDLNQPLPDLWASFDTLGATPMMIVRGDNSKLLSKATVAEMVARRATETPVLLAAGQGHAPILHVRGVVEPLGAFITAS